MDAAEREEEEEEEEELLGLASQERAQLSEIDRAPRQDGQWNLRRERAEWWRDPARAAACRAVG